MWRRRPLALHISSCSSWMIEVPGNRNQHRSRMTGTDFSWRSKMEYKFLYRRTYLSCNILGLARYKKYSSCHFSILNHHIRKSLISQTSKDKMGTNITYPYHNWDYFQISLCMDSIAFLGTFTANSYAFVKGLLFEINLQQLGSNYDELYCCCSIKISSKQ